MAQPAAGQGNHVVSGIRATFSWTQEKDVDRAILLKRDFPDTFEVFLEIVDGARMGEGVALLLRLGSCEGVGERRDCCLNGLDGETVMVWGGFGMGLGRHVMELIELI